MGLWKKMRRCAVDHRRRKASRIVPGAWSGGPQGGRNETVRCNDLARCNPARPRGRCPTETRYDKECVETSVTLGLMRDMVSIQDIDDTTYDVDKWDSHGLTASFGGDASSRCQRHVLTMDFESGAVSVADIPTRQKGCEAFTETNSYRLVRGMYYVDASPANDMDKQRK
jgi:hypothetical protein